MLIVLRTRDIQKRLRAINNVHIFKSGRDRVLVRQELRKRIHMSNFSQSQRSVKSELSTIAELARDKSVTDLGRTSPMGVENVDMLLMWQKYSAASATKVPNVSKSLRISSSAASSGPTLGTFYAWLLRGTRAKKQTSLFLRQSFRLLFFCPTSRGKHI